jgi:hypothetical protein
VSYIRNAETEIAAFLKRRADDILNLELTIRLFDENRIVDVITALEMVSIDHRIIRFYVSEFHDIF